MDNKRNTPSAPVQQSVREAFEKWVCYESGLTSRFFGLLMRKEADVYFHEDIQRLWLSYQAALSTSPLLDKNDQAEGEDFEAWWKREGQFVRAGGGDYEKCFAYAAWNYAHPKPPQPDSNELADMLRRLEVSANTVDYCYARNPGNFASAMAGLVDSATAARELLAQSPSVGLNTKKGQ
jgi:hypothetical protein